MHRHQVHHEAEDQPIGALTYSNISIPGANFLAFATAINNRGVVVGQYQLGGVGSSGPEHAFIYDHGIVTTIDPPDSRGAGAQGINDSGEVVGFYTNSNSDLQGFTYDHGVFSIINVPAAHLAINNHGEVTGNYFDSDGIGEHGFIYERGVVTPLDVPGATQTVPVAINNSGEIAGKYVSGGSQHGFVYDDGAFTTIDVPSALSTRAVAINDRGDIVGGYQISAGLSTQDLSFLYHDGTFTTIEVPGSLSTTASDINDRGEIVGGYKGSDAKFHGFAYDEGTFITVDFPNAFGTGPNAVNNRGEIVGLYVRDDRFHSEGGFIASPSGKPDRLEMTLPPPPALALSTPRKVATLSNTYGTVCCSQIRGANAIDQITGSLAGGMSLWGSLVPFEEWLPSVGDRGSSPERLRFGYSVLRYPEGQGYFPLRSIDRRPLVRRTGSSSCAGYTTNVRRSR